MKFYITYGCGSEQGNNFSVVEGPDYGVCRAEVDAVTNGKFACMYSEDEFAGQAERYALTEIPLQPQTRPDLVTIEARLIAQGYSLNELDRDNPYWPAKEQP